MKDKLTQPHIFVKGKCSRCGLSELMIGPGVSKECPRRMIWADENCIRPPSQGSANG